MRGVSITFPSEDRVAYGGERVDVVLIGSGFDVEMESPYPKKIISTVSRVNLFAYKKNSNKAFAFISTDPAGFAAAFVNQNYPKPPAPEREFEVSVKVRAASIEEARAKVTVR